MKKQITVILLILALFVTLRVVALADETIYLPIITSSGDDGTIAPTDVPSEEPTDIPSEEPTETPTSTPVASPTPEAVDIASVDESLFLAAGLVGEITEESCTLSGGTETTCYRFTVISSPVDHNAGPWCPGTTSDGADAGGIWPANDVANDVDGSFIENLATFYNDSLWKLYNDDGSINVTETAEECAAAARPDVDVAYQNHCVQCLLSYVDSDLQYTYIIPITPVEQDTPGEIQGASVVGVSFNGVNFDPPAPQEAILAAYTIAPFDDCGGHVNLNTGYHYHSHTGCQTEIIQTDTHAPLIGYAMDGFGLYSLLDQDGNESADLDESRGHSDSVRGYHYHVASAGTNSFINSFHGEYGCYIEGDGVGETCDASATTGGPGGGPPGGGPPGR